MKKIIKIKISKNTINIMCIMKMDFKERCDRSFKCMIDFFNKIERVTHKYLNEGAFER